MALEQRHERFLEQYMESFDVVEAARKSGLDYRKDKSAIVRLLAQPEVRSEIRVRVGMAVDKVQASMPTILDSVFEMVTDPMTPAKDRLNAIKFLAEVGGVTGKGGVTVNVDNRHVSLTSMGGTGRIVEGELGEKAQ